MLDKFYEILYNEINWNVSVEIDLMMTTTIRDIAKKLNLSIGAYLVLWMDIQIFLKKRVS